MAISVIVPAHNEANVIERLLRALTDGVGAGEVEIIVVCNGCTDDTAGRARRFGPAVRVIETSVASKSHALNLGDRAASGFPRFYVDADVVLTADALRRTAAALEAGEALAAAPTVVFDLRRSSAAVRAFYRTWGRLPYLREGMVGSGAYALSAAGRARFDSFPDITADDAFVRLQFSPDERRTVRGCSFTVTAPRDLASLVRIKTRGHFGNIELRRRYPALRGPGAAHGRSLLSLALAEPRSIGDIAVYVAVRAISKLLAYRRHYFGNHRFWERDETSRSQPVTSTAAGARS